ncbi:hypothetical protein [Bradyrhizobium centrosematis]|uniref:hypothetical protein n=1 Tax=Bradyrhizobium centrosematis TaxID=1300039 RepID=UPI0038900849
MVRILVGAETGVKSTLVMPSDAELRQLAALAYAAFPMLDTRNVLSKDDHDLAFKRTFWSVGWLGRLPEVEQRDPKHTSWWCDYLSDLLRDHRIDHEVEGRMFAAATLSHGDVPHTIGPRWPYDACWGLTYPFAGKPPGDAWRQTLAAGRVPAASPLPYSMFSAELRIADRVPSEGVQIGFVGSTFR